MREREGGGRIGKGRGVQKKRWKTDGSGGQKLEVGRSDTERTLSLPFSVDSSFFCSN